MNIVVAANSKYMRYLYIMLLSLFDNNRDERINVYVMQRDFMEADKNYIKKLAGLFEQNITFIQVDEKRFKGLPVSEKFSLETYFRLMMAELLPSEIEKVLYLDVDIIVRRRIKEFYETELNDYIAAVCLDGYNPVLTSEKRKLFNRDGNMSYFNAGVMLWNLKRLRKDYNFESFMEAGKELGFNLQFADQEILNYLLYDNVLYCDSEKYNYIALGDVKESELRDDEAVIMHYAGCNPWQNGQKNELYRIWWRYAAKTPFYTDLLEENLFREMGFESEKQELILRDMESREIYEFAFKLKGSGRIKAELLKRKGSVVIYGAGTMAEVLFELLDVEQSWNRVAYVIDKNKRGIFHEKVLNSEISVNPEDIVIVTPVYRTKELINTIKDSINISKVTVISLREWLKNIN